MELDIREAGRDDFAAIWPIFQAVVADEDTFPHPADISFEDARDYWFAHGARVWNVFVEGKLVASRYIVPNKPALGAHVCNTGVIIAKAWRGKGLGRTLNDFAIAKARELGFAAIQLNFVVATNEASIRICQHNGFEIVGTLPGAFHWKRQRYVDAHVMFLKL